MAKRKTNSPRNSARKAGGKKKPAELTATQRKFLAAYRVCGNITRAAEIANLDRDNHYQWMERGDSENGRLYRDAFESADEEAAQRLEAEARRRAEQGTSKPVFYRGVQCGVVQEYSDTLLIFLLKARRPERYRDRYEITHKTDDDLERELAAALAELAASGQGSPAVAGPAEAGPAADDPLVSA